ncbi:unnamed protein product [marine sediment metagenome]|uniref:Uncharacterized protein n=1 Tax=marine sediment metagenome TaxID=412755 RepID=X1JCL4_9ZZZZ
MATIAQVPTSDIAPRLSFPFQKSIGVYLKRIYGNVRFKVRYDLGSNENVFCVVELVYPYNLSGIIVGIPHRVVKNSRRNSPPSSNSREGG